MGLRQIKEVAPESLSLALMEKSFSMPLSWILSPQTMRQNMKLS